MTVIDEIITSLEGAGYTVEEKPQEKTYPKQIIVILNTIDIEVESPKTYRLDFRILIRYSADSSSELITRTKQIIQLVEPNVTALHFRFESPEFDLDGRTFYGYLPCIYTEVLQV